MEKQEKQMDLESSNKLIAEFMGITPSEKGWYDGYELQEAGLPFSYGAMGNGTNDVKFHSSWDWLMLIVEKIDSIIPDDSFVTIEYNRCLITVLDGGFDIDVVGNSRIEATYKAVVEFIKWYNENN